MTNKRVIPLGQLGIGFGSPEIIVRFRSNDRIDGIIDPNNIVVEISFRKTPIVSTLASKDELKLLRDTITEALEEMFQS